MSRRVNLDYTKFETIAEIKDKYPLSTLVMRKQFVDMATEHEWNHGRRVGEQIGVSTELSPRCNAAVIAWTMTNGLIAPITSELEKLISDHAGELGKLHVRVSFYKEPPI